MPDNSTINAKRGFEELFSKFILCFRRCWFILTRTWGMKNPLKLSRNFKMHMRFYLTIKRKAYDDELRREELLNYFRRFQTTLQKNGEHGFFASEFAHSEAESEDPFEESKRIACKRCGSFHVWVHTNKSKSRARWCQLKYGHFGTAKTFIRQRMEMDGSSNRPNRSFSDYCRRLILLRLMFVQTGRYIMLLNGIFICQEMRCAANTHKPSFQVNTSLSSKQNTGKGSNSGQRMPASNMEETMTQEEFFQWLQNAVQAGVFYYFSSAESLSSRASKNGGAGSSSGGKRKKKGKKKW